MICPLHAAALRTPDAPCIVAATGTVSYREADRYAAAAGRRLQAAGCAPGDRVGVLLHNTTEHLLLIVALIRAGAVACLLSTRWPEGAVDAAIQQLGCTMLISDARRSSGAVRWLDARPLVGLSSPPLAGRDATIELDPDADGTIVFTSGSTGQPKGAVHTLAAHALSAAGSLENIPLESGDRWLLSLPLYHVGGLAIWFRCLMSGAGVVLPEAGTPLHIRIATAGVTHVSLVSTQLRRLLDEDPSGVEPLRAVLLGGSAIPDRLLDAAVERGWPVATSYGSTEMASQVSATPPGAPRSDLATSGRVLRHREVRISDHGEILVRGATLFRGYAEPDVVTLPVDGQGWFASGDLGALDEAGRLIVAGRRDRMFISGGENIQPEEIERALERAGVEEVVVIPIPDDEFGWRPVAFIRQQPGERPDHAALVAELGETLPRFKIPVRFYPLPTADEPAFKANPRALQDLAMERVRAHGRP
jgi:o-succinylbenzoate---CoA ligase